MKNKFHNQIAIINYITSTDKFKLLFFLAIIFSLYASLALGNSVDNLVDAIFIPFQFNIFNIIFFSLLFLNNLNTCSIFEKKFDFYIMRLQNKNKYIKESIKSSIIINLFYILIFLILYFSLFLIFRLNQFEIHNYANYNISNFIYLIYYLLRYIILAILINVIFTYVYINFKDIVTISINTIFLIFFLIKPISIEPLNNLNIVIWDFFTSTTFANFSLDLLSFLTLLIIIELIIIIIHNLTLLNKKVEIS